MITAWPLRDDESRRAFLRAEAASLEPEDEEGGCAECVAMTADLEGTEIEGYPHDVTTCACTCHELSEWDVNEDRYREDFRDRD